MRSLLFLGALAGVLFVWAIPAQAEHCGIEFGMSGTVPRFENYELVEYRNDLLVFHFKLATSTGGLFRTNLNFLSDECGNGTVERFERRIFLPPGTQFFSIRFTSTTTLEVWDDATNAPIACANCVQSFFAFPSYYETFLFIFVPTEAVLQSSSHRIRQSAPGPPVKTATLPTPAPCAPFGAAGYFFDQYERAEYVDGLLAWHFRRQTLFNDGRAWYSTLGLHNENCELVAFSHRFDTINTQLTPFSRYYSVRFASSTHYDIWNDETNAKESCPACSVDIPGTLPDGSPIRYVSFRGIVDPNFGVFLNSTPFPIRELPSRPDPVIIIPGILGSSDKNGAWVIDPIFHTYDDLIDTLEANGYAEGKDLFTLPYDWRQSNVLTALQLRDKINEVQTICSCAKVDLVAHSMGGLVARQYIQSDKYESDVDQLIFLGTPHLGAPKAYLMWEGGENDSSFSDRFMKFVLSREAKKAGFNNLFDYVRNKPILTVQQLLPIYNYIRDKDSGILRSYPSNYPQNTFLESLKNSVDLLLSSGVKVTNIVGELVGSTINTIRTVGSPSPLLWEHGYPEGFKEKIGDQGLELGLGDGTVPSVSGEYITTDLSRIAAIHRSLPTKGSGAIFEKLTGNDAVNIVDRGPDIDVRLLIIKIISPADILIVAPNGKKIGKDFVAGQEINEIEGAFYSGFLTDNEYVTIPNPLDGEYQIQTQGTGTGGSYTVAVGYITEATSTEAEFNGETAPGVVSDVNFAFASTTPGGLGFTIAYDDVLEDMEMSYQLGWITTEKARNTLRKEIEGLVKKGKGPTPKNLKSFVKKLEKNHPKNINDQAYNLLKEDIEWLLSS